MLRIKGVFQNFDKTKPDLLPMNCWMCEETITDENRSLEHIILNAIGGRLKSYDLLCKQCNSGLGDGPDAALASQLNNFSNLLNIRRDRSGPPPPIRRAKGKDGTQYDLFAGEMGGVRRTNPEVSFEVQDDGSIQYSISARSEEEMLKILAGIKRKYPQIDLEEAKKRFVKQNEYFAGPVTIDQHIGGNDPFRSLCKSAINFYMLHQGNRDHIKHLIPFVAGNEYRDCVFYFYPDPPLFEHQTNQVLHILSLFGDPDDSILAVYIELFSSYCFTVLLNEQYNGPAVQEHYSYNLLEHREHNLGSSPLSAKIITSGIRQAKDVNIEALQKRFSKIIQLAQRIQNENKINSILQDSISILEQHDGEPLTEEILKEFFDDMIAHLLPWLASMTKD